MIKMHICQNNIDFFFLCEETVCLNICQIDMDMVNFLLVYILVIYLYKIIHLAIKNSLLHVFI